MYRFPFCSVTYVVGTLWNSPIEAIPKCTYNILPFNKWVFFTIKLVFSQTSQLLFMFQCNEHVEMNKFLCSLHAPGSQFYIIDSFNILLDISLECNANLVVAWLYVHFVYK